MMKTLPTILLLLFSAMFVPVPVDARQDLCFKQKELDCKIKVKDFTVDCGKYRGFETTYNNDLQKVEKKEITAFFTKNTVTVNGITSKFKIKNNKLFVNGYEMYEVIDDNKILLFADGGVYFSHE